jgi:hypothetical protein
MPEGMFLWIISIIVYFKVSTLSSSRDRELEFLWLQISVIQSKSGFSTTHKIMDIV